MPVILGIQHNSRNSGRILSFRAPKGQMGQKRPFPLKNGLFLVCSTIAEIRGKFYHFGPQKGRWARNGPFPFKNRLSWSTAQEQKFGPNLIISGPKGADGQKRPVSDPEFSSQASRPRQDRCSRLEASSQGTI